jgi:prolyl-tRNA editing enzyme YbaK/EbsC (Cys-tRNA(Pro) deacylase)
MKSLWDWRNSPFRSIFAPMLDQPPVARALDLLGLPYTIFRHTETVASLEQAASQRGHTPQQVIRSILFRLGEGNFVMVLMAGPAQISWPTLRKHLGQSRLTMAGQDEVLAVTGYRTGAVSPLGLPRQEKADGTAPGPMRILADESVFIPEEISIGSGERGVAVILRSADLRKALPDVEIGQFAQT